MSFSPIFLILMYIYIYMMGGLGHHYGNFFLHIPILYILKASYQFWNKYFFFIFHRFFLRFLRDFLIKMKNRRFIDLSYDIKRFFLINNNGCFETCVACHFQNTPYIKKMYSQNLVEEFLLSRFFYHSSNKLINVKKTQQYKFTN